LRDLSDHPKQPQNQRGDEQSSASVTRVRRRLALQMRSGVAWAHRSSTVRCPISDHDRRIDHTIIPNLPPQYPQEAVMDDKKRRFLREISTANSPTQFCRDSN
jgi:hypothetical protein